MNNLEDSESWSCGLAFSVLGSFIGALSKLCIRKSYTVLRDEGNVCDKSSTGTSIEEMLLTEAGNVIKAEHSETASETSEDTSTVGISYQEEIPLGDESETWRRNVLPWTTKLFAIALRGGGMFGMSVLGPLCNVYALQFASPSILCPFGSGFTLVWIVLFSECIVGEKPRSLQIMATGLIVLGEVGIAIAGDRTNVDAAQIGDVLEEYRKPRFLIYSTAMALWLCFLVTMIRFGNSTCRRLAWGLIGGSVTGVQCFIKDALAVLHEIKFSGFHSWPPLGLDFLLMLAGIFPLTGLLLLMECMRRFDALYSASMFMSSLVVSASIMSAVHYHTFDHIIHHSLWVLYPVGLLLLLSGAAILSMERSYDKTKEDPPKQEVNIRFRSTHSGYGAVDAIRQL